MTVTATPPEAETTTPPPVVPPAAGGNGGDLNAALREERSKRKALAEEVARLRAEKEVTGGAAPTALSDTDLLEGKSETVRKVISEQVQQHLRAGQLDYAISDELDKYAIFADDKDTDLAADARNAVKREVMGLPQGSGIAAYRATIMATAKRYDEYKLARQQPGAGGAPGAAGNHPPPTGGGAATAAHLKAEPPKSMKETGPAARSLGQRLAEQLKLRW